MTQESFSKNVHSVLKERRTIYKFEKRSVDESVVKRAIDCARYAPNHKMTEPWRFILLGEKTRTQLFPIVEDLAKVKCALKEQTDSAPYVERAISKVRDVPLLMVVLSALSPGDAFRTKEDFAATTCALHHVVLSLWADGIGAQWSTGGVIRDVRTYEVLGVNDEEFEIIGLLKAGHPQKIPVTKRLALEEIYRSVP